MKLETLYEKGEHKWIFIGRSDHADERLIDTNQYAIVVKDHILLMDPGGAEIFPPVMTTLSSVVDIKNIKYIFCSHQDPDIISSIPLWMALCPNSSLYASWLWKGFLAHYGGEFVNNYMAIGDNGMSLELGPKQINLVPAHYCHSPGNFSLFDPEARILFSGDIGGAVIKSNY